MSAFSHRLTQVISDSFEGISRSCAKVIGISESMLSRYQEETRRPSKKIIRLIAASMNTKDAVELVSAHLKDELPAKLDNHISIEVGLKLPQKRLPGFSDLSERAQEAVKRLVHEMLNDKQTEEVYLSLLEYHFKK